MQKLFALKIDEIISYNKELSAYHQQFENKIKELLGIKELSIGSEWYTLTFNDFTRSALNVKLTGKQQSMLEKHFNEAVGEALELKALVEETDRHILRMVHDTMEEEALAKVEDRQFLDAVQQRRAAVLKGETVTEKKVKR